MPPIKHLGPDCWPGLHGGWTSHCGEPLPQCRIACLQQNATVVAALGHSVRLQTCLIGCQAFQPVAAVSPVRWILMRSPKAGRSCMNSATNDCKCIHEVQSVAGMQRQPRERLSSTWVEGRMWPSVPHTRCGVGRRRLARNARVPAPLGCGIDCKSQSGTQGCSG